jgi:hypothetical protein
MDSKIGSLAKLRIFLSFDICLSIELLGSDLICVGSLEGATSCRARRWSTMYQSFINVTSIT